MSTETSDPIDLLTSGHDLFLRPLSYTITMQMLATEWWLAESTPRQSLCVVFEDCKRMKVLWHGKFGPYRISLQRLQGGLLEFRDSNGEFEVICRAVTCIAEGDVPSFFYHLQGAAFNLAHGPF